MAHPVQISHFCMFLKTDNDNGFIQCTIKPEHKKAFEALGFVDNVNDLPSDEAKKRTRRTKEQMQQDALNEG